MTKSPRLCRCNFFSVNISRTDDICTFSAEYVQYIMMYFERGKMKFKQDFYHTNIIIPLRPERKSIKERCHSLSLSKLKTQTHGLLLPKQNRSRPRFQERIKLFKYLSRFFHSPSSILQGQINLTNQSLTRKSLNSQYRHTTNHSQPECQILKTYHRRFLSRYKLMNLSPIFF